MPDTAVGTRAVSGQTAVEHTAVEHTAVEQTAVEQTGVEQTGVEQTVAEATRATPSVAEATRATPTVAESAAIAPEVAEVADNFIGLMRSFNRARTRMLAAAQHDVEWSASVLLKCLANEGPMRASAVADCLQSDPSTVSRQVAALVRDGLLVRRADPQDGRASILVLTPRADAVLAEHDQIRLQHFAEMLADWDASDLRLFASLLNQFTRDFESVNNDALRERLSGRTSAPGGKN